MALAALTLGEAAAAQEPPAKKSKGEVWTVQQLEIARRAPVIGSSFFEGTQLELRLRLDRKIIVGIDDDAVRLDSFLDDKGTNLLGKQSGRDSVSPVLIEEAGRSATMTFRAEKPPSPGATRIRIKGAMTVLVAKDEKQIETKEFALAAGAKTEIGEFRRPPLEFGGNMLEFIGARPLKKAVLEIADGKQEKSERIVGRVVHGQVSKTDGREVFHSNLHFYSRGKLLSRGVLRLTYYDTVERVELPLDIEAGLSIARPANVVAKDKEAKASKWTVAGLRVAKGGVGEGTTITAVLRMPDLYLVAIDQGRCKLGITDDKGTDLLEAPGEVRTLAVREPEFSVDGSSCGMRFHAANTPAKAATKIRIKGTIVVMAGTNEKQVKTKGAEPLESLDLDFGTLRSPSSDSFELEFIGSRPLKSLTGTTADGLAVDFRKAAARFGRPNAPLDRFKAYFFPGKAQAVELRISYFDTVERISVPIDLEVGLGF
jgi:hypothetical protein